MSLNYVIEGVIEVTIASLKVSFGAESSPVTSFTLS
jgi:hypothetical protein